MMENSNAIQTFVNTEFGNIRILKPRHAALNDTLTGKILFCGKDVAEALGYDQPHKAIERHCRYGMKCTVPHPQSLDKEIEMTFIPEGDVYRLIVRSNLPTAEKFERWVFDVVLPSIRETGGYILSSPADSDAGRPTAKGMKYKLRIKASRLPNGDAVCSPILPMAFISLLIVMFRKKEIILPKIVKTGHKTKETIRWSPE